MIVEPQLLFAILPFSLGFGEMALLAIVAVVLFGGRLPEVARTFGGYYQQFRNSLSDIQNSIKNDLDVSEQLKDLPKLDDLTSELDFDESPAPSFDPPPESE
jgi:sec-independent protein translocase protein TatA